VTVDVPDQKGRMEILKVHSRNKKLDTEVDLQASSRVEPLKPFTARRLFFPLTEASGSK
jgi:cell division protease FtsH